MPFQFDISAQANADTEESFEVKYGTTPENLSGIAFTMQFRENPTSDLLFEVSTATGGIVVEGHYLTYILTRPALEAAFGLLELTQTGDTVECDFDLIGADGSGLLTPWATGRLIIWKGVTR
jgi:hypothetical protein